MPDSSFPDGATRPEPNLNDDVPQSPDRYSNGTMMTAMFPARLNALRAVLPDPSFTPTVIAPGVGVVGIHCFEYDRTDDGPYDGLAITIMLNQPYFCLNLPDRALVSEPCRCQFDGWVWHLPVTSDVARADHHGDPRFLATIRSTTEHRRRTCRLSDGSEDILTLSGVMIPAGRTGELQLFSHLWIDGQPKASEFKINAHAMGESFSPEAASLTLGERHPVARKLAAMLLQCQPLCYQYLARFEGSLHEPGHPPALREHAPAIMPAPEFV